MVWSLKNEGFATLCLWGFAGPGFRLVGAFSTELRGKTFNTTRYDCHKCVVTPTDIATDCKQDSACELITWNPSNCIPEKYTPPGRHVLFSCGFWGHVTITLVPSHRGQAHDADVYLPYSVIPLSSRFALRYCL